jgi:hypothetical protein
MKGRESGRGVHQWRRARREAGGKERQGEGQVMTDIPSIEHDFRRILNSRRSRVETTKMAEGLFQKINEFYGTLKDESAKMTFRADYKRLAETRFGLPSSRSDTTKSRLTTLIFDHARNLKGVEATKEKLSELGDF